MNELKSLATRPGVTLNICKGEGRERTRQRRRGRKEGRREEEKEKEEGGEVDGF